MHKLFKYASANQSAKKRSYCFPNMPVGFSAEEKSRENETAFRPIYFDEKGFQQNISSLEANNIFDNTKESEKDIEAEAYRRGLKKGKQDGLKLMREELEPVLNRFVKAAFQLEETNQALLMRAEVEAVSLSLAIAEKIIHQEVKTNKDIIRNVAKAALQKIVDHKQIKIRLSSSDYKCLKDIKPELLDLQDKFETLSFEKDDSITTGGCVIETELGDIDARIESQIQVVQDLFRGELQKLRPKG